MRAAIPGLIYASGARPRAPMRLRVAIVCWVFGGSIFFALEGDWQGTVGMGCLALLLLAGIRD